MGAEGRRVLSVKGVGSFPQIGAPTVVFSLPVPSHLTSFPLWTLHSCHFPSLLLTLWSPTEREVSVCVSRGTPLPKFLPNHTDPSLFGEGFLEEEGRACVEKGGERVEAG